MIDDDSKDRLIEGDDVEVEGDGALEGEEVQVLVMDEEEAPAAPEDNSTIKRLRAELAEKNRLLAASRSEPQLPDPGPKPTHESCGYDDEEFEAELRRWDRETAAVERAKEEATNAQESDRKQWQGEIDTYRQKRALLPWDDVDDVEGVALAVLNPAQQAVIVKAAADPAKLLYALGKFPGKLEEIAAIKDPIKLAYALAALEKGIAVMPKRRAVGVEEIETGTASIRGSDARLAQLEKEAENTGDRTKIIAYKRAQKRA